MGTRTVRLDAESERLLVLVRRAKGLSVSSALKQGLVALRDSMEAEGPSATPFAIYQSIDLGSGGSSRAPARRAKRSLVKILREKTRR